MAKLHLTHLIFLMLTAEKRLTVQNDVFREMDTFFSTHVTATKPLCYATSNKHKTKISKSLREEGYIDEELGITPKALELLEHLRKRYGKYWYRKVASIQMNGKIVVQISERL